MSENVIVEVMPKSCGWCEYGKTYDLSIDDLVSQCKLTSCQQDWCDLPNRSDGTLRMFGCPLKLKS